MAAWGRLYGRPGGQLHGVDYICLQSHTSEPGWDPPATPALWSPVSSGSSQCAAAPSAPIGLAASNTTSSGTTLSWGAVTAPANCSIASYTVLQNGGSIGTAAGTSLSVTGLAASTTYSFTVEATDADGTSSPSTVVSVTTPAGTTSSGSCGAAWNAATAYTGGMTASENGVNYVANWWTQGQNPASNSGAAGSGAPWTVQGACSSCSQAPPTPSGLSATTTYDSANLSWAATTPPASCTVSYTVQVSGQSSATTSSTSDSVTGLASSTSYTFTVAATDAAGSSSAATGSFTTQANPCNTVPTSAPTNLTSASTTGSSTTLSWSAVTAPSNCTISYTITGGPATLTTSNTTDTVTGLTPSTAYTFAVAATDAAGSGPTSTVTVNTTNAPTSYFVGGWFEEWGTYYANSNVADLQNSGVVNSLTHVIYAFAKPGIQRQQCRLRARRFLCRLPKGGAAGARRYRGHGFAAG